MFIWAPNYCFKTEKMDFWEPCSLLSFSLVVLKIKHHQKILEIPLTYAAHLSHKPTVCQFVECGFASQPLTACVSLSNGAVCFLGRRRKTTSASRQWCSLSVEVWSPSTSNHKWESLNRYSVCSIGLFHFIVSFTPVLLLLNDLLNVATVCLFLTWPFLRWHLAVKRSCKA